MSPNGSANRGWIVLEIAIGAGALQLIREADRVHLLFTDINLADAITGWDVADAGRVSHPDLAVIYASGGPKDHGPPRASECFSVQACVAGRYHVSLCAAYACRPISTSLRTD